MFAKSNYFVACLLAGSSSAILNTDVVNAYQRHLADQAYREGHIMDMEQNQTSQDDYHPGVKIVMDPTTMRNPPQGQTPQTP